MIRKLELIKYLKEYSDKNNAYFISAIDSNDFYWDGATHTKIPIIHLNNFRGYSYRKIMNYSLVNSNWPNSYYSEVFNKYILTMDVNDYFNRSERD